MDHTGRQSDAPDIREYLAVLRRRKWSIAILTILVAGSAVAFSIRQTPIYASTSEVLVKPPTSNQVTDQVAAAGLISMDTERAIADSQAVATVAAKTLGATSSPSVLLKHLDVSVPANSQILEITYSDPDPVVAQDRAAAFANAYITFKTDQALEAYARVRESIQSRVDRLLPRLEEAQRVEAQTTPGTPEHEKAANDAALYTSQISILRTQNGSLTILAIDPGSILKAANLPTTPASPNHLRNGALGLVLGLALGVGFALLRERLDERLRGREELDEAIGAPTLAVIPSVPGWKKGDKTQVVSLSEPTGPLSEAYRGIRTNLQFIARSGEMKVLAITSPTLGEGKTTTSANLAVVLAQTGKRVIAVSADLRKPRLHRFFGLENTAGVTSVLTGQTSIAEAVQRVKGLGTLLILASGPIPPNPAELAGSEDMQKLLTQLRGAADFVIIDTPPVLAVSDALQLAPFSDGILIVADAASTTQGALAHVRERLEQVGANIIGGVLNNLDPSRAKTYPSYYRYYNSYRYRHEPEAAIESNGRRHAALDPEELWR